MRYFLESGSQKATYLCCVELSNLIEHLYMPLVEWPFCCLLFACPFRSLCSGSGTSVGEEERRDLVTGFVRLRMLNQIEDWIVPFHYWQIVSWSIGSSYYQMVVVDGGWGTFVLADDTVVAKQAGGGGWNECLAGFRTGEV
jgi:hypothetical protein